MNSALSNDNWNDASKIKSIRYTVVGLEEIRSYSISGLDKCIFIETDQTENADGVVSSPLPVMTDPVTVITTDLKDNKNENENIRFSVQGTCDGKTITLPADGSAYTLATSSAITIRNALGWETPNSKGVYLLETVASGAALKWKDLIDYTAYGNPKKQARIPLKITVNPSGGVKAETISKLVTVLDARPTYTSVVFSKGYKTDIKEATLNPDNMKFYQKIKIKDDTWNYDNPGSDLDSAHASGVNLVPVCTQEYKHEIIKHHMLKNSFSWLQGSVYVSTRMMTSTEVTNILDSGHAHTG